MALPKFDSETFRKSVLGLGAGAAVLMLVATTDAQADNEICLPLEVRPNGQTMSAGSSALGHSDKYKGTIAIAAYPGGDLRNTPQQLTNYFRGENAKADCFVNDIDLPNAANRGTMMMLYIAGVPVSYKGKNAFSVKKLVENPEILRYAISQAFMATLAYGTHGGKIPQHNF